jgi:hypothetical protein
MPRETRPGYALAVTDKVTAPLFLCELHLVQDKYFTASFDDQITARGNVWKDSNLVVTGPTQKSGGSLQATISLPFDVTGQNGITLFDDVVNNRPHDRPIKLWITYWYADNYLEPILVLDGVIDSVRVETKVDEQRIVFSIMSVGNRGGVTPSIRLAPPMLKYRTPVGTVISFNNQRYEING